jgi:cell division septum initiation protein DivIVA
LRAHGAQVENSKQSFATAVQQVFEVKQKIENEADNITERIKKESEDLIAEIRKREGQLLEQVQQLTSQHVSSLENYNKELRECLTEVWYPFYLLIQ